MWHRVPRRRAQGGGGRRQRRPHPRAVPALSLPTASLCAKAEVHKAILAPARVFSPRQPAYGRAPACLRPNHCAQRRSAQGYPRSCPCVLPAAACLRPCTLPTYGRSAVRSPRDSLSTAEPPPADGRSAVRSPRVSPPTAESPARLWAKRRTQGGEGEAKGGRPLAQCPAPARAYSPRQLVYRPAPAA